MKNVHRLSTAILLGLGITIALAARTSRFSATQTRCDAPPCTTSRTGTRQVTTDPRGLTPICQIRMRQTLQIEDTLHGPSVATAWVDSDGRGVFVVDAFNRHTISVFDARNGEFLQSLGSRGQGPGEFMGIAGIRVASDSLLVATLPHYAGFFMSTGELVTFRTFDRPGQMQIWSLELECR